MEDQELDVHVLSHLWTYDLTKQQHLPIIADNHIECVVCSKVRSSCGASRSSLRDESQVRCSSCNVALCLNKKLTVISSTIQINIGLNLRCAYINSSINNQYTLNYHLICSNWN